MFFTFSQPQHVLNLFLNFWRFSASCSYKKGSYEKKECIMIRRPVNIFILFSVYNNPHIYSKAKNQQRNIHHVFQFSTQPEGGCQLRQEFLRYSQGKPRKILTKTRWRSCSYSSMLNLARKPTISTNRFSVEHCGRARNMKLQIEARLLSRRVFITTNIIYYSRKCPGCTETAFIGLTDN